MKYEVGDTIEVKKGEKYPTELLPNDCSFTYVCEFDDVYILAIRNSPEVVAKRFLAFT